jgi:hypothetical protein
MTAAGTAVVTAGFRTRHQPGRTGKRTVRLGCVLRRQIIGGRFRSDT